MKIKVQLQEIGAPFVNQLYRWEARVVAPASLPAIARCASSDKREKAMAEALRLVEKHAGAVEVMEVEFLPRKILKPRPIPKAPKTALVGARR